MADTKVYKLSQTTLPEVACALEDYLRMQKNMETEGVAQAENVYFIQARQTDGWKKFAGLDKAIQVKLTVHENYLTVDVGAGRWVDKLGAATVGYLMFAPLMITAAIGAIGQERLPQDIFSFVERFVLMGGAPMDIMSTEPTPRSTAEVQPAPDAANRCAECDAELPDGARFCPNCGAPVSRKRVCANCGTEAAAEANFCSACGTRLN